MKGQKYIYDSVEGVFRKSVNNISAIALKLLKYLLAAFSLAVVWYLLFALLINTDEEKRLRAENRQYAKSYARMEEEVELLEAVVAGLNVRDNAIYNSVFRSGVVSQSDTDFEAARDLSDRGIAEFTSEKLASALDKAASVDANFRRLFSQLDTGAVLPPLSAPVEDFTVKRTGASVGLRYSPFLGTRTAHDGLDIIAPSGSLVIAAADGVVESVSRSLKGKGNVVTVSHKGGYSTVYAHLGSISVRKGQKVGRGDRLGTVGMSGVSYAPHLHYEVLKDGEICDPAEYMFAAVTPDGYVELRAMAAASDQSLE